MSARPMTPMKAISLSRPWPYAIIHLGKRLENRQRCDGRLPQICGHRGPLLLHAAKSWDSRAVRWMSNHGLLKIEHPLSTQTKNSDLFPAGGIFGRCRAIAHVTPDGSVWTDPQQRIAAEGFPKAPADVGLQPADMIWHMHGQFALILADVEPTPFVKCRGWQGLWKVPPEVLAQLEAAA